jgi:integrase
LPHIGPLRVDEVKPRHIPDLMLTLRSAGKLAPRSILKVSATLHSMFKSALIEELTIQNPVVLEAGVLPKKADSDPEWRHQAISTHSVRPQVPSRSSPAEASELTWRQLDTVTKPLGRILLGETKSGVPRAVPIRPTLAKMIATWRLSGWFNTYGCQPSPEDLIVPTLTLKRRTPKEAQDALVGDLKLLGLRVEAGTRMNRRGHDLRRAFVSLAQADGARRDVIEWGTHGPRGDIMSMYTSMPWPTICEEWSKLRIELREGD